MKYNLLKSSLFKHLGIVFLIATYAPIAYAQAELPDAAQEQAQRYQDYLAQKAAETAQTTISETGSETAPQVNSEVRSEINSASTSGLSLSQDNQERCITIMSSFPNNGALPRYQFLKLSQDLAIDSGPNFRAALNAYGEAPIADDTPILDIVETIANPVIRQAAPEIIVANMDHIIGFAQDCQTYVDGQIQSLRAADSQLAEDDIVIAEDALYLRQILLESLIRLGVDNDAVHGPAIAAYEGSLLRAREDIEFAGFDADITDLEALYLTDLDGRLARSNDIINSEINRESLGDAVILSNDLSNSAIYQEKTRSLRTLISILGGR